MNKPIISIIVLIAITILGFGIYYTVLSSGNADAEQNYNNGIHENCGGTLIYQQAVGHYTYTSYMFRCDKCNDLVEIASRDTKDKVIYYEDGSTRPSTSYETYEDDFYDYDESGETYTTN